MDVDRYYVGLIFIMLWAGSEAAAVLGRRALKTFGDWMIFLGFNFLLAVTLYSWYVFGNLDAVFFYAGAMPLMIIVYVGRFIYTRKKYKSAQKKKAQVMKATSYFCVVSEVGLTEVGELAEVSPGNHLSN